MGGRKIVRGKRIENVGVTHGKMERRGRDLGILRINASMVTSI